MRKDHPGVREPLHRSPQSGADPVPHPGHVDLEPALVEPGLADGSVVAQVREPDAGANRLTPRSTGHLARRLTVPQYQLASPQHGLGIVDHERDQPSPGPSGSQARAMSGQRVVAEEVLLAVEGGGEDEPGLNGREVGGQLAPERAVALLQPEGLDRVVARLGQTEIAPAATTASYTEGVLSRGAISSQPSSPT